MKNCCIIYCTLSLQFLNLFLTILLSVDAAELVEFLFRNQMICGQPFSDAQWVPVLDQCELDCKAEEEICMEDDQMKQTCRKHCKKAFQKEIKQQNGNNIFNLLTDKTTTLATTKSNTRRGNKKTSNKKRAKVASNNTRIFRRKDRINLKKYKNENLMNNTEAIISPIIEQKVIIKNKISLPKTIKTTKKRMMLNHGKMRKNKLLKMKGRIKRKLKEDKDQNKIKNKNNRIKNMIKRN
ncbi:hypothetical protein Mgra_00003915 [Meloidogyne graminicola]|uniref:Uncharacterized protein n=1 Tax=Meloidogyne graminicola TaxID=189291 RepID=A0A8S9ZUD3_9BILA|nr:hypothetical protein Mgra_00003915 [Meloidogyne graminicola]